MVGCINKPNSGGVVATYNSVEHVCVCVPYGQSMGCQAHWVIPEFANVFLCD